MNFYDIYFWKLFSKPGRYRLPRPRFSPPSTTAKIPVASIPAPASGTNRFPTDRAHRLDEIVRIARLSTAPSLPSIVTHPPRRFSAFGPRFQSWRARGGGRGGELLSADPEVWGCRSSFFIPIDIIFFLWWRVSLECYPTDNYLANEWRTF